MEKIVLIIATGRSGSTTIKNVINLAPNTNICGENRSSICDLMEFFIKMKFFTLSEMQGRSGELYNSFDINTMRDDLRRLIRNMFKRTDEDLIWGFKEICWLNKLHVVDFFMDLFPKTKIILNYCDDIESQSKSVLHLRKKEGYEYLKSYNTQIEEFRELNSFRFNIFVFKKSDISNIEKHRELYKFLDIEEFFNKETVANFLHEGSAFYKERPFIGSGTSYDNLAKRKNEGLREDATNEFVSSFLSIEDDNNLVLKLAEIQMGKIATENIRAKSKNL